jgi:hypothetical protein
MMSKKIAVEIAAIIAVAYLAGIAYAYTGAKWFASLGFWGESLPLLAGLIPFLVIVVGPGTNYLYDKLVAHHHDKRVATAGLYCAADAFTKRPSR